MKSVIYKITNLVNSKIYIGSAVDFKKRVRIHLSTLKFDKHPNIYLQRSYNKHGKSNFKFSIIEEVKDVNNLLKLEQYWIDYYGFDNLYNLCPNAKSRLGSKHSEETKKKLSLINKGKKGCRHTKETKKKISIANSGKKRTEKMNLRSSLAHIGKKFTEEHKKNIRLAKQINNIKVNQYTLNGYFIKTFKSLVSAAKFINKDPSNISKCCHSKQKTAGGYIWKFDKEVN